MGKSTKRAPRVLRYQSRAEFARELTEPEDRRAFRFLADLIGGVHVPEKYNPGRVTAKAGLWEIVFDRYDIGSGRDRVSLTRVRTLYRSAEPLTFRVYGAGRLSGLFKRVFRLQDIEIGHGQFDARFIVKASNPDLAVRLLSNESIVAHILAHPDIAVVSYPLKARWRRKTLKDVVEITVFLDGMVTDVARLEATFKLTQMLLQQLVRIGCADRREVRATFLQGR